VTGEGIQELIWGLAELLRELRRAEPVAAASEARNDI